MPRGTRRPLSAFTYGDMSWNENSAQGPDGQPVAPGKLHVTIYERGAVVKGFSYDGPTGGGKRKKIGRMSPKSRHRLCWELDNAAVKWGATTLLTFQAQRADPKACLERFVRVMTRGAPGLPYAWWMETQGRGVTHFHFVWGRDWLEKAGWLDRKFWRIDLSNGTPREFMRGPLDCLCVRAWLVGLRRFSVMEKRFNAGGRSEPVREHSRIAWYAASEAGKKGQKDLPPGVENLGRWWYLSPEARPVARGAGHLCDWPFPRPLGRVFDAGALDVRPGLPAEVPASAAGDDIPY